MKDLSSLLNGVVLLTPLRVAEREPIGAYLLLLTLLLGLGLVCGLKEAH
jgi:hypothetical protein